MHQFRPQVKSEIKVIAGCSCGWKAWEACTGNHAYEDAYKKWEEHSNEVP